MQEYYEFLVSFYPQIVSDPQIVKLFCKNGLDIRKYSFEAMLQSNKTRVEKGILSNKEVRLRMIDSQERFSYVIVDARNKEQGGSPHQNSHEHYYTIEVCRIELGYAIAAHLLSNKNVKLVRYQKGECWVSVPCVVHNTSLQDGSLTTTLKTPSPFLDWYGTGNLINSKLSYYVDSRTKTMDLEQMNYVIDHYDGIVDHRVVEEFRLDEKWNVMCKKQQQNPYEVLITERNRNTFLQLLLTTKNNDLAAFYANLTRGNIKMATDLAQTFGNNIDQVFEELSSDTSYDIEKVKGLAKTKNF